MHAFNAEVVCGNLQAPEGQNAMSLGPAKQLIWQVTGSARGSLAATVATHLRSRQSTTASCKHRSARAWRSYPALKCLSSGTARAMLQNTKCSIAALLNACNISAACLPLWQFQTFLPFHRPSERGQLPSYMLSWCLRRDMHHTGRTSWVSSAGHTTSVSSG